MFELRVLDVRDVLFRHFQVFRRELRLLQLGQRLRLGLDRRLQRELESGDWLDVLEQVGLAGENLAAVRAFGCVVGILGLTDGAAHVAAA